MALFPAARFDMNYWAPEALGMMLWERTGDPLCWTLYQLYEERDTFQSCVEQGEQVVLARWPAPPGHNYPGNCDADRLRLMEMATGKTVWQYHLCAHLAALCK